LATTRPFAYNTGPEIPQTTQIGNLAIGVGDIEYANNYGGVKWWMGPNEDLGYVIAKPIPAGNQPNPLNIPAYVGFNRSVSKTEESFLSLVSVVFGQNFDSGNDALVWLNNNGYWTSFEQILPSVTPTPTLTPTPTNSVTPTQTPTNTLTPTLTQTPTTTPTPTKTPTPSITSSQTPTPTITKTPTNTSTPTTTPSSTPVAPVSSGLEIYYDPSNSSSYPGSGTILYDLSPSTVNATISGSPSYGSNAFTFTGSQTIITGNLFGLFAGWQHTLEIWIRPTISCCVFSDTSSGPTNVGYHATGLEFYSAGPFMLSNMMLWNGTAVTRVGGGTTPLNTWYQYVRVYNGSNTAYAYVNKVKSSPETSITWSTPSPGWYLNFGGSESTKFSTGVAFQGQIGVIRLYNRVLNLSEITQNYNADKSKYGLV